MKKNTFCGRYCYIAIIFDDDITYAEAIEDLELYIKFLKEEHNGQIIPGKEV